MVKFKLQLLRYLATTLNCYVEEGYIELNKFITDSIKNHIDYVSTEPGNSLTSPTVDVEVQLPMLLAFKLCWKALTNKTLISSIVNEALSFTIPCLLEQEQEREDYGLEVELME